MSGNSARKLIKRTGLAIAMPVLLFLLLEAVLRVVGFGEPATFFVPSATPGFVRSNEKFAWRFTPPEISRAPCPIEMSAKKPAGATRIFVLGSSAAQGFPDPAYSVGRFIETMYSNGKPAEPVEVVNVALTAMNSHVVRVVAAECAAYEPDWFIVYCGNNEVIGPYGPGTVFRAFTESRALLRLQGWFSSTRTSQALAALRRKLGGSQLRNWGGMDMFSSRKVFADDPRLPAVYAHFRANLSDIADAAASAGAKTLFCTVPVNLRDCPPFASTNRAGLASAQQLFDAGKFQDACDADGLRFRTDSSINRIIREVAAARSATLCDLAVQLDGDENFHEHVHLNPAGTWRAATQIYSSLTGRTAVPFEVCRETLALTDYDELRLTEEVLALRSRAPFIFQSDYSNRIETLRRRIAELKTRIHADAVLAAYNSALNRRPDDAWLWEGLARFLDTGGNPASAVAAWKRVADARPSHNHTQIKYALALGRAGRGAEALALAKSVAARVPRLSGVQKSLGDILAQLGDFNGAVAQYRLAVGLDPANTDALVNLGTLRMREGAEAEAESLLRRALELQDNTTAHNSLALLLAKRGDMNGALPHFQKASAALPDNASMHHNVGAVLLNLGRIADAAAEFEAALRLDPSRVDSRRLLDDCRARR